MNANNNVSKDYLDEAFKHINTKLEHIIQEQVNQRLEQQRLAKETETIRFLTKHKGLFLLILSGIITIASIGGIDRLIKFF